MELLQWPCHLSFGSASSQTALTATLLVRHQLMLHLVHMDWELVVFLAGGASRPYQGLLAIVYIAPAALSHTSSAVHVFIT